jgi:hypothetical protein
LEPNVDLAQELGRKRLLGLRFRCDNQNARLFVEVASTTAEAAWCADALVAIRGERDLETEKANAFRRWRKEDLQGGRARTAPILSADRKQQV